MIQQKVRLPYDGPPVLGVGAFLKNTVTLLRSKEALISPINGDLDKKDAIGLFTRAADFFMSKSQGRSVVAAHDLHPDFYNSRWALSLGLPTVGVQHHHAHVAAVMAEHGLRGPVLGIAFDGFGLGDDGGSWGGELLAVDAQGFRRLGRLRHLPQPGGDKAAREPWRMAAAVLHTLGKKSKAQDRFGYLGGHIVTQMLDRGVNCRPTSSAGRLFDAVAALAGVRLVASFEGQGPMELEKLVARPRVIKGSWSISDNQLDLLPLLDAVIDMEAVEAAEAFHGTLIAATGDWVGQAAQETGLKQVVLSGGCFFNRILAEGLSENLARQSLQVLRPIALTPGDPAISLGQAWAAAIHQES